MASDAIIRYDNGFIGKFLKLADLLEGGDKQKLYDFLKEEFGFIFRMQQYYAKNFAEGGAKDLEEADEAVRRELMRPLSHRQYRMVERAFGREDDDVISSIWDFLHDYGRIYDKTVMSCAEIGGCSLILEQVYCCLSRCLSRPPRNDFDEEIDRSDTNALKLEGFREYIFHADKDMEFPFRDDEFIHMWVADMEFATPDFILDAICDCLNQRILGYSGVYSDAYYEAFGAWCREKYGMAFPREQICFSSGVVPALFDLVRLTCGPGDKVLINTPAYAHFKHACDANGTECVFSDLVDEDGYYTFDFEDFERKASAGDVRMFILCNPHNPSGRAWRREELERVAAVCERNHLWVVSDEIHCDLLRKGLKHVPMARVMGDYDRLVTCMAVTKTFNAAGLAFSNVIIADPGLRRKWATQRASSFNPLSIAAAQAAYEEGASWLEELKEYLDGNFRLTGDYLAEHLPLAVFRIPEATYLAWVDMRAYFEPGEDITAFFANEAGVLLEAGGMFVSNDAGFVRLNLACPKSMLREGLRRICEAVNARAGKKA